MNLLDALLLGILEGLTEFLPVSSTGHLILLGHALGHNDEASKSFDIIIQLGAILAVLVYFRSRLTALVKGALRRDPLQVRVILALGIAFIPAALFGFLFHKFIKAHLFGPMPVALALVAGGFAMIAAQAGAKKHAGKVTLEHVTPRRGFGIGLAQCFALWPGASRSMTTIVGGQLLGLPTAVAAEFSFLLAIPTLGAATLFDLAKNGHLIVSSSPLPLVVGLITSFVVAMLVIAGFLSYLKRYGMLPFAFYRIALGVLVFCLAR